VPILPEKDTLETIRAECFVRFHGVKGGEDFSLGNGVGEGKFARLVSCGVVAVVEGAVVMWLGVDQKDFEVILSFWLENSVIRCPGAIRELESVNSIFLSFFDVLSMKEKVVFVSKFSPLLLGFSVPKAFLLERGYDCIHFAILFQGECA